jgi:hypothetical protein
MGMVLPGESAARTDSHQEACRAARRARPPFPRAIDVLADERGAAAVSCHPAASFSR